MDIAEIKNGIHQMVDQIPDEELEEARRLLQALVESRDKKSHGGTVLPEEDGETLIEPLEDESMLRPEFLAELKESEEAARRGEVVSLEEIYTEIFSGSCASCIIRANGIQRGEGFFTGT